MRILITWLIICAGKYFPFESFSSQHQTKQLVSKLKSIYLPTYILF